MLEITIPARELYDSVKEEFVSSSEKTLLLEHSLLSISKWEMVHNKPLLHALDTKELLGSEFIDYIRCMTIGKQHDMSVYTCLTSQNVNDVISYMNLPMTATTVNKKSRGRSKKRIVTSELIYYWMIANGIPFECEKWHINRLLTLIEVCGLEGGPKKRMPKQEVYKQYAQVNEARRAKLNSKG